MSISYNNSTIEAALSNLELAAIALALPLIMIQVHKDLEQLPEFKKAVITIGTFDGVHLGHQQIIKQLKTEASQVGGETVIITFHPHPRKIVGAGRKEIKILNTLDEKIELLNSKGLDHLVVVPFNPTFSNQTPEEYIENFLVKKFNPHTIIIGYDHKFGKDRAGDYHLLEDLGKKYNYKVKEIPEHVINEVTISSTRVREALSKKDIDTANHLLGYNYFFSGEVIQGNKIGRTIGFPTANLKVIDDQKLIPGNGVYVVQLMSYNQEQKWNGMMNIGVRPTVDGTRQSIEVNIFDFDQNIYNTNVRVFIRSYLRDEVKFESIDELKNQLAHDKEKAKENLKASSY